MVEQKTPFGIEFSDIRVARERREHEFVLKRSETVPARAVLKAARG
jgi:hypothetical protein